MNISPIGATNHRYESQARREIADALRTINTACDDHLASTGCPMDQAMERLERRQSAAERALDSLCRPHRDAGRDLPLTLLSLARNKDKTAQKLRTLRTLQPLRQANFDAFEGARTPQEVDAGYQRIRQNAQPRPFVELEEVD